jgi:hypothetical protein
MSFEQASREKVEEDASVLFIVIQPDASRRFLQSTG